MILTETQIDQLLHQEAITEERPWSTNDEQVIDRNVKDIVAEICRRARLKDKTEYGHYGSGYASYVDCWLYRPNDDFRISPGNHYHGLVILFSRLSPFYVLGQGSRSWDRTGGAFYLPDYDFVDVIEQSVLKDLVPLVTTILTERGLTRLHKTDLDTFLPAGVQVPTILAQHVLRHFDALFYWED